MKRYNAYETVEKHIEEIFFHKGHSWDVIVYINCELDFPDKSVGYRGGWDICEQLPVKYIEYNHEGDEERRLNSFWMRHDLNHIKIEIDKLADEWILKHRDSILEDAGQQANDKYESDQQDYADAKEAARLDL